MECHRVLKANCHSCFTVSVPEHGEYLSCSSSEGGILKLYELSHAACDLLATTAKITTCTLFSPQGELLCSGFVDGTLRLYNTDGGELMQELKGHTDKVTALAFDPRGRTLCSASVDCTLRSWRVIDGKCSAVMKIPNKYYTCLVFHPKRQNLVACGTTDGSITVWDITNKTTFVKMKGHKRGIQKCMFHPLKPNLLCSASTDRTVRLWNWENKECVQLIDGQMGPILTFSIIPKTGHLLLACRDEKLEEEEAEREKKNSTTTGMIASFMSFMAAGAGS